MQRPTDPTARAASRQGVAHLMWVVLVLTAGCGQGMTDPIPSGAAAAQAPESLHILTTDLPTAQRDVAYPATRIETRGGDGVVRFQIVAGQLPTGLSLTVDGRLIGQPEETGAFPIVVRAQAGAQEADRTFVVPVEAFSLVVTGGLRFGQAWSGRVVSLRAVGAMGDVSYEVLTADSNGLLVPEADGRARYLPGPIAVEGGRDRIRATDAATGTSSIVELQVCPDPVKNHLARFGETDVWYVDFERKEGVHPFASDWHAALARLGLRGARSTGSLGNEADQKADLLCRKLVLGSLNVHYLRQADGQAGPRGLAISFPIDRPAAPFTMPAAGRWLGGSRTNYSVIALTDIAQTGTVGTAIRDDGNRTHENNSPGSDLGPLGVFINRVVEHVEATYRTASRSTTSLAVSTADIARLDALLYEDRATDERAEDIAYVVRAIGRSTAAVLAHEIGHGLGLGHTARTTEGSLMNAWVSIHPLSQYAFLPEDLADLAAALPGPGRLGAVSTKPTLGERPLAAQMGPSGADVCGAAGGCSHR
jgi:hypothetical protein